MPTDKQILGQKAEAIVASTCSCPKCKRSSTLRRLPPNFRCADVICDFCGYLAQVKAIATANLETLPDTILGAAWRPQKDRMDSGIYFPLFIVQIAPNHKYSIFYLPADLQTPGMFIARKPLSSNARRAGWQGFLYDLRGKKALATRLV